MQEDTEYFVVFFLRIKAKNWSLKTNTNAKRGLPKYRHIGVATYKLSSI